jgi:hypothetical protein
VPVSTGFTCGGGAQNTGLNLSPISPVRDRWKKAISFSKLHTTADGYTFFHSLRGHRSSLL